MDSGFYLHSDHKIRNSYRNNNKCLESILKVSNTHKYLILDIEKKTIVFDMDETLIKSVYKKYMIHDYDECTKIPYPRRKGYLKVNKKS